MSLRDLLNKQAEEKIKPAEQLKPAAVPIPAQSKTSGGLLGRKSIAVPVVKTEPISIPISQKISIVSELSAPIMSITQVGIPDDLKIDVEALRKNLNYLAANIEQKELIGQVVRTIAVQLRSNPRICTFMQNTDYDLIVRGLRRAFNVRAYAKQQKKDEKVKKSARTSEVEQMFKDAGIT